MDLVEYHQSARLVAEKVIGVVQPAAIGWPLQIQVQRIGRARP